MKQLTIFLCISACFFCCTEQPESIHLTTINENEFNSASIKLPTGKAIDSIRLAHDNCMGFSFDANAVFAKTNDTYFVGSLVNRQSLKVVNTIGDLGLSQAQLMSQFTIITNPCYEKTAFTFPLRSILGNNFILALPGVNDAINKEINDDISAADSADIQTGSWVFLDLKDALQHITDTIKSPAGLQYKKNMLDTSNMVITAVESITDVSFLIDTKKDISPALQALLKTKPSVPLPSFRLAIKLAYISNNKFEMTLDGFFPMVGQFMKAEVK